MQKSHFQNISVFIACGEFPVFINKICNLISFDTNFNFPLVFISLVNAGMP